jgi:tetratricopeptide (TPR) repeat protein
MAEAEEIAKLNTELYPNLGITHYALGEIYRHAGKRDLAIESYLRAQELNPGAAQVAERLKQLQK